MKNIKLTPVIWLLGGGSIALLFIIAIIMGTPLTGMWDVLKKIPTVISIDTILVLVFIKWGWKLCIFRNWLVPFPNLEGTWKGFITTTWVDPKTNTVPPPIRAYLAIKQSFTSITCAVYTEEMPSESYSAEFVIKKESGSKYLVYNYFSKPRVLVRDRSKPHDGSALLKIVAGPPRKLVGEYWTSRKTTGEMDFEYLDRKIIQQYQHSLSSKPDKPE
jgi:hypothetical protein